MNKFQSRLKEVMSEKKFSQQNLADILHTTQATISRWINGIQEPDYNMLFMLCKLFEVSADYLLGLTDEY